MTYPPTLYRAGFVPVDRPDAHTLTGRAVTYDQPADVVDLLPSGELESYREGFRSGAFDHQFAAPQRVRLVDGHLPDGSHGPDLAIATGMRNDPAGLLIDFQIYPETSGKLETLLGVGVGDLSIGFSPARMGTTVDAAGVRWRTKALLRHVSLEAAGSYTGAEVLAYRADPDDILAADEAEYLARTAELDEYLETVKAEQAAKVAEYAARGLIDTPAE